MHPLRNLQITFCLLLLAAALLCLLFETGTLVAGALAGDALLTYWLQFLGIAQLLVLLPLALRLMKFGRVQRRIQSSTQAYQRYSVVRLLLLGLPLLYNVLCYYLLACEPTFGYMALMTAVAFLYVWPSQGKMDYECEGDTTPSAS